MPLTTATLKQPTVQHIAWDGSNATEIGSLLEGAGPFGWTVRADGDALHLTGGPQGDTILALGTVIVGPTYWGATAPAFVLAEILTPDQFAAKYGA